MILGLGEPSYFYVIAVFTLNGVMVTLFFLLCYHVRYVTMTISCIMSYDCIVIVFWVQCMAPYNSFTITLRLVLYTAITQISELHT